MQINNRLYVGWFSKNSTRIFCLLNNDFTSFCVHLKRANFGNNFTVDLFEAYPLVLNSCLLRRQTSKLKSNKLSVSEILENVFGSLVSFNLVASNAFFIHRLQSPLFIICGCQPVEPTNKPINSLIDFTWLVRQVFDRQANQIASVPG